MRGAATLCLWPRIEVRGTCAPEARANAAEFRRLAACGDRFRSMGILVGSLARVRRVARAEYSIRSALELPEPTAEWPSVSVVVPLHNEELVIQRCISSMLAQEYDRIEFIFVLDRCTDGTHDILLRHAQADSRITLIENDSSPADWASKCHAAQLGANSATGDRIIFTDADTSFDPKLVRAAVAMATDRRLHLLSLLSTLTTRRWFERVVQPVAAMHLTRMYPIERVNRTERPRPFANGQFMLFDRAFYDVLGGHEGVKNDLLEDVAFARLVHAKGGRCGIFLASRMLTCSMYDSFDQLMTGWKRIFIETSRRRPRVLRKNARLVYGLGIAGPMIQLATLVVAAMVIAQGPILLGGVLAMVVAMGFGTQIAALLWIYRLSGVPLPMVLLFPVGSWFVGHIFSEAARDLDKGVPIRWAGREYTLEPRD
jgi:glycosyltransferase involved in cell wall biosynthesis